MKVTENVTVYTCEHCKKKNLFIKHAMIKHELNCSYNPINNDACHACAYCEDTKVVYQVEGDYGNQSLQTRGFHCSKLNIDMYPHKAKMKGLPERYPETFEGKIVMPNECKYWNYTKD